MIHLNQLHVGYEGRSVTPAIDGCFAVGSLTAIIGANGAGKSTLLKTLARLQPAVAGEMIFTGCKPCRMAYLPQQSELDTQFPIVVFDLVAMGCWPQSGLFGGINRRSQQQIEQALDTVGMSNMSRRPVGALSGGQLQRVLFARLLVQQSPLILLDEPFTGIDSQTVRLLLSVIRQWHREGKTVIAVLHDMTMVNDHFPQALLLHAKRHYWDESKRVLQHLPEIIREDASDALGGSLVTAQVKFS